MAWPTIASTGDAAIVQEKFSSGFAVCRSRRPRGAVACGTDAEAETRAAWYGFKHAHARVLDWDGRYLQLVCSFVRV